MGTVLTLVRKGPDEIGFLNVLTARAGKFYSTGIPGLHSFKDALPVRINGVEMQITHVAESSCAIHDGKLKVKTRDFGWVSVKKWSVSQKKISTALSALDEIVDDIRPALLVRELALG